MEWGCLTVPVDRVHLEAQRVHRLPPSARRVFQTIVDIGPTTLPLLEQETGLARRTLAYAMSRLKREGLVAWHARLDDFRYRYFFVHPQWVEHEGKEGEGTVIRIDGGDVAPSQRLTHLFG